MVANGFLQVIVWGVVVGFVPITAGLSLLYMLIGKAISNRMARQHQVSLGKRIQA